MPNSKIGIRVWTDGSCFPNPGGPGGWAAIILAKKDDVDDTEVAAMLKTSVVFQQSSDIVYKSPPGTKLRWKARVLKGGYPAAEANTNNRMELRAILEALRAMDPCKVEIITDSQYAIGMLSGRNRVKKNQDMAMEFNTLSKGFDITWTHVRGHNGDPMNTIADLLAGGEANEYKKTD